ncbi:MAG: hypothetical protein WCI73_04050 [Phycisphaerae bacterium]
MALSFTCPHCRKEHRGPDTLAGKPVKCTECSNIFTVPISTAAPVGGSQRRPGGTVYGAAAAELAQDAAAGEFNTAPAPAAVDGALLAAATHTTGRVCPHCGQKVLPSSGARICVACGSDLYAGSMPKNNSGLHPIGEATTARPSVVAVCIWGGCATVMLIFSLAFYLGGASALGALILAGLALVLAGITARLLFKLGEMWWAIAALGLALGGGLLAGLSIMRIV